MNAFFLAEGSGTRKRYQEERNHFSTELGRRAPFRRCVGSQRNTNFARQPSVRRRLWAKPWGGETGGQTYSGAWESQFPAVSVQSGFFLLLLLPHTLFWITTSLKVSQNEFLPIYDFCNSYKICSCSSFASPLLQGGKGTLPPGSGVMTLSILPLMKSSPQVTLWSSSEAVTWPRLRFTKPDQKDREGNSAR